MANPSAPGALPFMSSAKKDNVKRNAMHAYNGKKIDVTKRVKIYGIETSKHLTDGKEYSVSVTVAEALVKAGEATKTKPTAPK